MMLGLVPAAIVFAVILAALIALGLSLPAVVVWLTPFDESWPDPWPAIVSAAAGTVIFAAAIVLAAVTFTALTLAVGDPFYERIWRAAELDQGGEVPEQAAGIWHAVRSSLGLIGLGVVTAIGVTLLGFIPLIGGVLAPVAGIVLSGRLLAVELSARAFDARGIPGPAQRSLRRGVRWQLLGFGVATQLLFMVPFGAVFTMPAAVAGSTYLARTALDKASLAVPRTAVS
jgi:CysZ protein